MDCKHYVHCQGDSLHTWDFENSKPNFCAIDLGLEPISFSSHCPSRSFNSIIHEIKNGTEKISDAWIKAQSLSRDFIIITPNALKSIFEYFDWGCSSRSIEKMCALMGHIYRNSEIDDEAFIVCVESVIRLDYQELLKRQ